LLSPYFVRGQLLISAVHSAVQSLQLLGESLKANPYPQLHPDRKRSPFPVSEKLLSLRA
jgi:hypothetical protein